MKRYLLAVVLALGLTATSAYAQRTSLGILVEEADTDPTGYAYKLVVPNGSLSLSNSIGTITLAGAGDVTDVGDASDAAPFTADGGGNILYFEGSTADTIETLLTARDPTSSDGTLYIPDLAGTTADIVISGVSNFTSDNLLLRSDGTTLPKVQNSGITVDDSNNMSGIGTIGSGAITSSSSVKGTSFILEGGTYDTTFTPGTPTAAVTYVWPAAAPGVAGYALISGTTGVMEWSSAGAGDVTTSSNITDNVLVRGDGGAKGIQETGITVADTTNNVSGMGTLSVGAITTSGNMSLDDGSGDSPSLSLQCAGDKTLTLVKLDAGGATIANNEGLIAIQPSNDTDDYATFTTASNVVTLDVVNSGSNAFIIANPGGSIYVAPNGDDDDRLVFTTTANVPGITTEGGANLTINSAGGAISFGDENLSTTGTIAFGSYTASDGNLIDLNAVTYVNAATTNEGLAIPPYIAGAAPASGHHFVAWDATNNYLMIYESGGWQNASQGTGASTALNFVTTQAEGDLTSESVLTGSDDGIITISDAGGDGGAVKVVFNSTATDDVTWGNNTTGTWTFDGGGTDATLAYGDGVLTLSHLTVDNDIILDSGEVIDNDTDGSIILTDGTNEIVIFKAVSSAANEITILPNTTGLFPTIQATGEANTGIDFENSESEEILKLDAVASAVNEITITNAVDGSSPSITGTGDSTNVGINIDAKAAGEIAIGSADAKFSLASDALDISNAGAITGAASLTASGTVQAEQLTSTDDADINDALTVGNIIIDEAAGTLDFTGASSATITSSGAGTIGFGDDNLTTTGNITGAAITATASMALGDGDNLNFGASAPTTDWYAEYNSTQVGLLFSTADVASAATTTGMFRIQVNSGDGTLTDDQEVLEIVNYDAELMSLDENGDLTVAGSISAGPADSGGVVLNQLTAIDTDWWFGITGDSEGDNDDPFEIGTGLVIGTGAVVSINPSGDMTLDGSITTTSITLEGGTYDTTIGPGTPTAAVSYVWPLAGPATSGYALTATTAGVMSWSEITATAHGSDTYIQFKGPAGTLLSDSAFTFDDATNTLNVTRNATDTALTIGDGTYSWGHTPAVGIEPTAEFDATAFFDNGLVLGDSDSLNEAGELDYSSGFRFYGGNSETLVLTVGSAANTTTITTGTGVNSIIFAPNSSAAMALRIQDDSSNYTILSQADGGAFTITNTTAGTAGITLANDVTMANDLLLDSDSSIIKLGDDQDITITHVADTGLLLTSTYSGNDVSLQLRDSNISVASLDDGHLDLVADTSIDINVGSEDLLITSGTNSMAITTGTGVTSITFNGINLNVISESYDCAIAVGYADTRVGTVTARGSGTGLATGGSLLVQTAADHDTTINHYAFSAYEDDLYIGPDTDTDALKLDADKDFHITAGSLYLPASEKIYFSSDAILSDSAGTMTLSNIDALDATTETTIETALDTLSNVTSLGTLTTLTVDDITINGNTISSGGASTLAITPTEGQAITLDGTVTIDAGEVLGITSLGVTGTRVTAGFFTDLTVTNAIAGSVTGNAATVTVADAANDTTTSVLLGTDATGSLTPATDSSLTYNANTGALTATSFTDGTATMGSGTITGLTGITSSAAEINGTITLANDEEISNAVDGTISFSAANLVTSGTITGGIKSISITTAEGQHDGDNNAAVLSDSGESFTSSAYIGMTLINVTDGSSCVVTANDGTTMTCTLAGGTDNDWDTSDYWAVAPGPYQSGSIVYIASATTIMHPATAGYAVCYYSTGANAVKVDPLYTDAAASTMRLWLDGADTDTDGDELDSASGAGDFICIHNVSSTVGRTLGRSGTWTDGGAS